MKREAYGSTSGGEGEAMGGEVGSMSRPIVEVRVPSVPQGWGGGAGGLCGWARTAARRPRRRLISADGPSAGQSNHPGLGVAGVSYLV